VRAGPSRQRSRRRAAIAALAAGLALSAACGRGGEAEVQVAAAQRGDLLAKVLCDGNLEPPRGGELRAADGGTVAELAVHEGERVRRGQLLLRLALPDLAGRAREARADLDRLESERASAAADLARAEADADYRRSVVAGDRRLLPQGAISRAAADADQLAEREATTRAQAARAQLAGLTGPAGGASGSQVDLARASAADLARRLAATTVYAPAAGVVYGLPRALGEVIAPGQAVARVADPDHPHVRFRVDQPDLPRVKVGERLAVTFNGLPGRQWEGNVSEAGAGLREAGGRQVGEGVGVIADPGHELPVDAAVDVQVVTGERHGVLTIPRAALRREGDRRVVYVLAGGRLRRREVEVGLIGLNEVEVTRGLAAGERVVTESPVTLTEGLRAHAAAA
jgi:HlyD family secretion protein